MSEHVACVCGHICGGGFALIEVRHVTKHYGDVRAVDGLSFTVPGGSVTGFLGPNGAGKPATGM